MHHETCSISLDASTKFELKHWIPVDQTGEYSCIWLLEDSFELNSDSDKEFQLEFVDESNVSHYLKITKGINGLFGIKMPRFGYEFEPLVIDELKIQLEACNQLLEYEADSKCKFCFCLFCHTTRQAPF